MLLKEREITGILPETTAEKAAKPNTITLLFPGDDDDVDDEDDDWSDIDDEDFEDRAEDLDDFHEMELENDIFNPDDDDHLPDDDLA